MLRIPNVKCKTTIHSSILIHTHQWTLYRVSFEGGRGPFAPPPPPPDPKCPPYIATPSHSTLSLEFLAKTLTYICAMFSFQYKVLLSKQVTC